MESKLIWTVMDVTAVYGGGGRKILDLCGKILVVSLQNVLWMFYALATCFPIEFKISSFPNWV
jgi:hypothetical protein